MQQEVSRSFSARLALVEALQVMERKTEERRTVTVNGQEHGHHQRSGGAGDHHSESVRTSQLKSVSPFESMTQRLPITLPF